MGRISLVVILALLSSPLYAGKIILMPEIGRGDLTVDEGYTLSGASETDEGVALNLIGGYKFGSNIILAANYGFTSSDDLFGAGDHFKIYDRGLLVGYSFQVAERFRIVPMVGVSSWELESRQGAFFNPGPEERMEFDGTDFYGRLNFEIPVGDLVQLNLSYINTNYDFGRMESLRFGVKFEF